MLRTHHTSDNTSSKVEIRTEKLAISPVVHAQWIGYTSGFIAGCADTLFNYPPYGFRYRIQRGEVEIKKTSSLFTSTQKIFEQIKNKKLYQRNELYRGGKAYTLSTVPATSIQNGVTDLAKNWGDNPASIAQHIFGSFLGGAISGFISAPVGNIVIIQQKKSLNMLNSIKHIYSYFNLKGFWRGINPTMIRDGIYSVTVFWGVEYLQTFSSTMNSHYGTPNLGPLPASICAGVIGAILSHPADMLATSMQNKEDKKVSSWQTAKEIAKQSGIKGFYRAIWWRSYAVAAGAYVMSTVSEKSEKMLKNISYRQVPGSSKKTSI